MGMRSVNDRVLHQLATLLSYNQHECGYVNFLKNAFHKWNRRLCYLVLNGELEEKRFMIKGANNKADEATT
jgi:hypothetical protein